MLEQYDEYQGILFSDDVAKMFAKIINDDEWTSLVFKYIGRRRQVEGEQFRGVTINEITKDVKLERKVMRKKGKKVFFEDELTNIHRQAAGNIVDKLYHMSLLSCKPLKPYKYYFITKRGLQVLRELLEINKGQMKKGAEING